jgi:TolA-binding protein
MNTPRTRLLPALLVCLLLPASSPGQDADIVQKLYDNAVQLLRRGKPDEALKGFEQIYLTYQSSPQAADALYQAASFHYPPEGLDDVGAAPRDRIQKAIPLFDKISKSYRQSSRAPEALYKMGLLALEPDNPRANPNEAYAAFTSVVNVYPGSPLAGEALFGAATSQIRAGQFENAVEDLNRLLEEFPGLPSAARARLALGYCLFRTGDFPRAMGVYQTVRDQHPGTREAETALERLTLLHRHRLLPAAGVPVTYAPDGTFPGRVERLGLRSVSDIAVGPGGEVLVVDPKQGQAMVLDARGQVTTRIPFPDVEAGTLDRKGEAILTGAGSILYGKSQKPLTRPDGATLRPVRDLAGLGADRDGHVLVGDGRAGEVLQYGPTLEYRGSLHRTATGRLAGVEVGIDNQVYVLDSRDRSISIYSDGKPAGRVSLSDPPASVMEPVALAVDDLGDLYVSDAGSGRVLVLEPRGGKVLAVLQGDRSKGGLSAPGPLAVDHQGRVYVFDRKADAILRFQ